ncbi:MAG: VOC family protein [Novosphingobium sp.]|nr:VOC family protein [Novosphingobium sp.]
MTEGKVLGIGGVFVRSQDPAALAAWYRDYLGIGVTESGKPTPDGAWTWRQEAGDTVFAMFAQDSDYFAADRQVMLNFRVSGLDALVERLMAAGIAVERNADWDHPDVGCFARIHDPEGNPVELWESPAQN